MEIMSRLMPLWRGNYILVCLALLPVSGGLQMLGISSPEYINRDETVELICKYEIGRDAIYSVKWYKDNNEVWRYIPSDTPTIKIFKVEGVTVLKTTRPNKLVLQVDGPKGSGEYKCEISVEAPTFFTQSSSVPLTVVVPPSSPAPEISGGKEYYSEGSVMELNCTVHKSKPAATLHWKINNNPIPESYSGGERTIHHGESGLETSILGLRFVTRREDFPGGLAIIRCEAEIAGGVWSAKETKRFSGGGPGVSKGNRGSQSACLLILPVITILALPTILFSTRK